MQRVFVAPVPREKSLNMIFLPSLYNFILGVFLFAKLTCSKKYGIVEITSKNYQSLVLDGEKDAWIVAVKGAGKISLDEWKTLEYNLRGLLVRVGIIDPNKDGAFLKKKVSNILTLVKYSVFLFIMGMAERGTTTIIPSR